MSWYNNKTIITLCVQMPFMLMNSSCSCISLQSFLNEVHLALKEYFTAGAEVRSPEAAAQISAAVLL